MKFIIKTLIALVLVCFSMPNANEAQADRIVLTMSPILASPNIIKDQPPVGTIISAGQIWMDRNLGASRVAINSTDSEAYGDYYQWGRLADGHEKSTSQTTGELSTTDVPSHGNFIAKLRV